jgi:predicted  nucleic acid-binding Zn-ribbon protein
MSNDTTHCPHCMSEGQADRPTHCDDCGAFLPEVKER